MTSIVKTLPSYIKGNQHALEIVRVVNFLSQDKLLFTMDISFSCHLPFCRSNIFLINVLSKNLALKHDSAQPN